jgi:hypothetical protein
MVRVWFLAFGLLLRRDKRGLAILAFAISIVGLLDPIGWILSSDAALNVRGIGIVLIPVWTAWFGIDMLRSWELSSSMKGSMHADQGEGLA